MTYLISVYSLYTKLETVSQFNNCLTNGIKLCPLVVNSMLFRFRTKSAYPHSFSNFVMVWLTADCEIFRTPAALIKLFCSATVLKTCHE